MKNKNVTLNNLWENRTIIINDCKLNDACEEQFRRLVRAISPKTFKQVILDNFMWVNENLNINPKFDCAYDFNENGIALIRLNNKYGYIKSDGTYLIEPIFDDAYHFDIICGIGTAIIKLNGKYGFIKSDGTYLFEPIFGDIYSFFNENGIAKVKLNGIRRIIDINGNYLD